MTEFSDHTASESRAMSGLARIWERIVGINADVSESEKRRGRLVNLLVLTGFLIAGALLAVVSIAQQRGYVGPSRYAYLFSLCLIGFVLLSLGCMVLAKRGRVRLAARLYVWLTFGMIAAGAALFTGYQSAGWLLMIWPVALAGSLLQPISACISAAVASLLYLGVVVAQNAGLYDPVLPASLESFPFLGLWFGWIMLILAVGLVDFVSVRSSRRALAELQITSVDLVDARDELARRVEERTTELQGRAEQFRAVAELSQAAAAAQDLETLLSSAVTLISRRLGFYHVGIFLLDASRRWAVLRGASSEGGEKMLARGHQLRVGQEGMVGYVAEMGNSRYAFNVGADAVWFRNPDLPETSSEMALPLIVGERVIGVLDIQTQENAAFDEVDVETLRVLADGVAVAIENVRRLEETQGALARLARYQEEDAIGAWRQALSRRHMRVSYTYHDGATEVSSSRAEGLRELIGVIKQVTREQTEDGRYMLYAPINVSGNQYGVLSFESASPWTDEAVRLVENVVNQLDLALTNARLLEETRLRAAREAARGEIVGRIRALNSTDAILRNAAEELGRAFQVERSRIQLVQFGE
jgi:GAF domain-containing protein